MNKTEQEFSAGYDIGLDAIQACAEFYATYPGDIAMENRVDIVRNVSAGMLSAVIAAVFYLSPNEKAARDMVEFAISIRESE
jgi:hypothetical protein